MRFADLTYKKRDVLVRLLRRAIALTLELWDLMAEIEAVLDFDVDTMTENINSLALACGEETILSYDVVAETVDTWLEARQ